MAVCGQGENRAGCLIPRVQFLLKPTECLAYIALQKLRLRRILRRQNVGATGICAFGPLPGQGNMRPEQLEIERLRMTGPSWPMARPIDYTGSHAVMGDDRVAPPPVKRSPATVSS